MEVTLLGKEQVFGEDRLKIFDEYGTMAAITDFAILLGGFVANIYHYRNINSLENRVGFYWTKSSGDCTPIDTYFVVTDSDDILERSYGVRPVIPYSLINNFFSNEVVIEDGILEVEYGEYPQKAVSKETQEILEKAYNNNYFSIKKTGKIYTTDSRKWNEYDRKFNEQSIEEYLFEDGKKYVRVKANPCFHVCNFILSNGEECSNGEYFWIEVSPIKWLVDVEKNIALSERILFAGIQFDNENEYKGSFEETFMYNYLNTIFIKDIRVLNESEISVIEEKSEKELVLEKDKQKTLSLRRNLVNKG